MSILYVFLHVEMKNKILIQALPCFYGKLLSIGIFFQTKAFEKRMDTFSQSCFDITHVSFRLPSLSQPSFCVGLLQQRLSDILNHRTNGPVKAHLISWPSKAQNIQDLENIW